MNRPAWSPEQIRALWDYYSNFPEERAPCFTRHFGDGLVSFAQFAGVLHGEVLDYGAGPGFLTKKLTDRGVVTTAADFSENSVRRIRERVGNSPFLRDAIYLTQVPTPLPDAAFDLIFCIEVVEHLLDDWLDSTMMELNRLIKPGGYVFISTPNCENLEEAMLYCPFCDSTFHQWQHIRSFTAAQLDARVAAAGLHVDFCRGLNLARFQNPPKLWPLHRLYPLRFADWVLLQGHRFLDLFRSPGVAKSWALRYLLSSGPNLVCIAHKPMA